MDCSIIAVDEFRQVHGIISQHRLRALQTVNGEVLLTAWRVGAFVSERLQNSAWGSKTVMQLSEYLRAQDPTLKGYSRRNIYNMVALHDAYSSPEFQQFFEKLNLKKFVPPVPGRIVQTASAQLESPAIVQLVAGQIVQPAAAQFENAVTVAQPVAGQIVQALPAQFPNFLELTTLSNHFEILNACKTMEERVFYVLYSHKERLNKRELQRCLKNNTFASVMGDKHNFSKGFKHAYPQAVPVLKDTVFVDFLGLSLKHSEKRLKNGILSNLKDFILEIGKDFLHYATELSLQVGNSTYKVDLVFYHRGL